MKLFFFSLSFLSLFIAFLPQQVQAQGNESGDTPAEASSARHRGDLVPIEYRHRGDLVPIEYKNRDTEKTSRERSFGKPAPKSSGGSSPNSNTPKAAKDLPEVKQPSILKLEKVQVAQPYTEEKLKKLSLENTRLVVHFKPGVELKQGTDAMQELITKGALILDEEFYDAKSEQYGIVLKFTNLDYALSAAQALFDEHEVQRVELKDLNAKDDAKEKDKED